MTDQAISIFLSAGEASGDLHGSYLVRALRAAAPKLTIAGVGGERLHRAGARVLVDNREIAVVGLTEVARHLKAIYRAWRRLCGYLEKERPALTILIDFPDFNLLLARKAKKLGSKIFYYISPQVWAWRSGRVRTLRRLVDRMAVILPFEQDFYAARGMQVHFVGHPLLEVLASAPTREEACSRYPSARHGAVVGLLPGSRANEIRTLLPLLLETAARLNQELPGLTFLLPVAHTLSADAITAQADAWNLPLRVVSGDTHGVIRACDVLLTASGTVTLEAAILGTPMIIVYRVSRFTSQVGRQLIRVRHVGLPNLIAGRTIVPELLQEDARVDCLADAALALLQQPALRERQRQELAAVRSRLGLPGAAERAARLALELIDR
jgi:lipid-A-disaccharide synthase